MEPLTGIVVSSILLITAIVIKKTILRSTNNIGTTREYSAGEYIISRDYAQFERVIDSETVSFIIKGRSFHYKFQPGVKIKMWEIEIVLNSMNIENNTVNVTVNRTDRHN
ncbi:hypothetical protein [Bacillus toyonensis]|uniref:hypothetical protein n=1 Tax=Bacillus toyonensis TaxID=155322 RepID=UPI002E24EAC7|nr:hypothetical protein [Bacillus toyonensis]